MEKFLEKLIALAGELAIIPNQSRVSLLKQSKNTFGYWDSFLQ